MLQRFKQISALDQQTVIPSFLRVSDDLKVHHIAPKFFTRSSKRAEKQHKLSPFMGVDRCPAIEEAFTNNFGR